MALSYAAFFAIYVSSLVLATVIGLLVLVGWKDIWLERTLVALRYNAVYIVLLIALPLLIEFQDIVGGHPTSAGELAREVRYTNWMSDLGGGGVKYLQSWLNYGILTDFFIVIYAWLFYFLIYFAPVLLLVRNDSHTLSKYAIAFVITYVVLVLSYALFPVSVTSTYSGTGVVPMLYVNSYWGRMITSIDPLNNDFPSGHVSLTVTTFLVFATAGGAYRRFAYFLGGVAAITAIAVLYLGIHWPADVLAGILVGVLAVSVARTKRIQTSIDRGIRAFTGWLLGPEGPRTMPKSP